MKRKHRSQLPQKNSWPCRWMDCSGVSRRRKFRLIGCICQPWTTSKRLEFFLTISRPSYACSLSFVQSQLKKKKIEQTFFNYHFSNQFSINYFPIQTKSESRPNTKPQSWFRCVKRKMSTCLALNSNLHNLPYTRSRWNFLY